MQLICPLCRQHLMHFDKRWHCENRHGFDIARQGYCNLLPVQQKKSLQPGDGADMVAARNRFLSGDYYLPIADLINQTVLDFVADQHLPQCAVIDAGCGEGYYSHRLSQALDSQSIDWHMMGVDISKHAVLSAAKRNKNIAWFVANSSRIPVDDHCADILLSLFSPLPNEEFYRCLKAGGLLIVASTGKNHLIELRQQVYDTVNEQYFDPAATLASQFNLQQQQQIQQPLLLADNAAIKDLFAMTPHYWRVSPEKKSVLDDLQQLTVSIDVQLHSFIAREPKTLCEKN